MNEVIDTTTLHEGMVLYGIPEHMHEGLLEYILRGRVTGHFLLAILTNDLRGAVSHADRENQFAIVGYVKFLTNHAPSGCWGNESAVERWIELKGLEGIYANASTQV